MDKQEKYSSKEKSDALDDLAAKLAIDLRKNIRSLGTYPIMTAPWIAMADIFSRMANISEMESNLADSKSNSTLWETEEQAIRFLIEDGKLNLCLRCMIDFKEYQRSLLNTKTINWIDMMIEGDRFEKGLGIVLKNAWLHVEAIQTTDLTALINYIADILSFSVNSNLLLDYVENQNDLKWKQEFICFSYLKSILVQIDVISADRIMPIIRESKLFMICIRFISKIYTYAEPNTLLVMLEALNKLTDTEDFETFREKYVENIDDAEVLSNFKTLCMKTYLSDSSQRKLIRSLNDSIDRCKRIYKIK